MSTDKLLDGFLEWMPTVVTTHFMPDSVQVSLMPAHAQACWAFCLAFHQVRGIAAGTKETTWAAFRAAGEVDHQVSMPLPVESFYTSAYTSYVKPSFCFCVSCHQHLYCRFCTLALRRAFERAEVIGNT